MGFLALLAQRRMEVEQVSVGTLTAMFHTNDYGRSHYQANPLWRFYRAVDNLQLSEESANHLVATRRGDQRRWNHRNALSGNDFR